MNYRLDECLAFSRGLREATDLETIKNNIRGCIEVIKTDGSDDRLGIDYVATLRRGARIMIDAKTRDKGCSRYWQDGPELAPEIWSVMPGGKYKIPEQQAKAGWTLCEKKNVDYIYCTFDPSDSHEIYLLPFQLYRMAFRRCYGFWKKIYKIATQESLTWESQCIFVPAAVILDAISNEMKFQSKETEKRIVSNYLIPTHDECPF